MYPCTHRLYAEFRIDILWPLQFYCLTKLNFEWHVFSGNHDLPIEFFPFWSELEFVNLVKGKNDRQYRFALIARINRPQVARAQDYK